MRKQKAIRRQNKIFSFRCRHFSCRRPDCAACVCGNKILQSSSHERWAKIGMSVCLQIQVCGVSTIWISVWARTRTARTALTLASFRSFRRPPEHIIAKIESRWCGGRTRNHYETLFLSQWPLNYETTRERHKIRTTNNLCILNSLT
jgi:hypothetical protein